MADPLDTWVGFASGTPLPDSRTARELGTEVLDPSASQVWGATVGGAFAGLPTPRLVEQGLVGVEEAGTTAPFQPDAPYLAFDQPAPTTPTLSGDEANEKYGIPGVLNFNLPISEARARLLNQQKRAAAERDDILRRNEGSLIGGAARLATGFALGNLDPLLIGSAFIPIPGVAALGTRLLAAAGESALSRFGARAVAGGLTGAGGTALIQPLEYGLSRAEWNDYTMNEALANIAFGTVLGGGLHAAGGYVGDRLRNPFAQRLEEAGPEIRKDALQASVAQDVEGKEVKVAPLIEHEIAARAEADLVREARRSVAPREMVPIQGPQFAREAIERDWATANRLGGTLFEDIERLAAEGKTAREASVELGSKLDSVRATARANNESEANAAAQFVRNVRSGLGIPSIDQATEHAAWLAAYRARAAGTAPRPEGSRPAPEGIPLMITRAMHAELQARGFSEDVRRNMTPAQAQEILREPAQIKMGDHTIERDHERPDQYVVKNPAGEVVATGIRPEQVAAARAAIARQDTLRAANDVVTAARDEGIAHDPTAEAEAQRVTEAVPETIDEAAAQKLLVDTEAELQTLREPGAEGEAAKLPADIETALKASEETFKADEGFAKAFVEAGACLAELGIPR